MDANGPGWTVRPTGSICVHLLDEMTNARGMCPRRSFAYPSTGQGDPVGRHYGGADMIFDHFSTSFTLSAASCSATALSTFKPLLSISSLASIALVPCKRTMIGTLMSPMFL